MPRLLLWVLNMSLLASPTFAARLPEIPIEKDLVYATVGGVELKYDWAKPPAGDGPFPFVLCIHAGGWQLGDKRSFRDDLQALAGRGYVAATVNYRLMPKYRWPAQLEDARAAVRYFRSRASDLKIDPARFGAVGDDAGAHLALMLGLLGVKEEKDKPVEQSTRLQAIVNIFGPTDLREVHVTGTWVQIKIFAAFGKSLDQVVADFLGTANRAAPIYYEASPIAHVAPGAPPILTIVGTADPLIPQSQPEAFHEALRQAGVAEEMMIIEGGEHDRKSFSEDSGADARMYAFFDKYLKPAG